MPNLTELANLTQSNGSSSDPYIVIVFGMFTYVLPTVCGLGFLANIINIVIFSNSELKEDIYTYLLAHSISNCLYTILTFFCWLSRSGSLFAYSSSYESKFYEIYFFFTGLNGFGTLSALIEIAISFDRLLLMKRVKITQVRMPPWFVIAVMVIVSALVSSVYSVIRAVKQTSSLSVYVVVFNQFGNSVQGKLLYTIVTVLKNIGPILILFVVNCMLTIEIKKFYDKKKMLLNLGAAKSSVQNSQTTFTYIDGRKQEKEKSQKSELKDITHSQKNFAKMTIYMFVIYLTGNITNAVLGICFIYYSTSSFFSYLLAFGNLPQFLSYGVNIFIYYNFNGRFKKLLLSLLRRMRII